MRAYVAFLLVACSGGSSGDWVPSDIDEHQAINKLGDAAYARLCNAFDDYVHDQYRSSNIVRFVCTAQALESSADAAACASSLDACLDTLPPPAQAQLDMILDQAGCTAANINSSLCVAPVSALTSCLDALSAQLETIQLTATCAAFGEPLPPSWWRISPPSQCTALQSSCGG